MELRPGIRLESAACDAQVVVVRAPLHELDLRCGGAPMRALGSGEQRVPLVAVGVSVQIGKRYAHEDLGLELLCTRAGEGALSVGDEPLLVMGAKPLPASD